MASREAGNTREILIVKHTELPDESGNPGNPGNPGHGRPVARAHSGISVARPGDTVRWTNRTEDDATLSFPRAPSERTGARSWSRPTARQRGPWKGVPSAEPTPTEADWSTTPLRFGPEEPRTPSWSSGRGGPTPRRHLDACRSTGRALGVRFERMGG